MSQEDGYNDYFSGVPYTAKTSSEWHRGWIRAERESRCGMYDQYGKRRYGFETK